MMISVEVCKDDRLKATTLLGTMVRRELSMASAGYLLLIYLDFRQYYSDAQSQMQVQVQVQVQCSVGMPARAVCDGRLCLLAYWMNVTVYAKRSPVQRPLRL